MSSLIYIEESFSYRCVQIGDYMLQEIQLSKVSIDIIVEIVLVCWALMYVGVVTLMYNYIYFLL